MNEQAQTPTSSVPVPRRLQTRVLCVIAILAAIGANVVCAVDVGAEKPYVLAALLLGAPPSLLLAYLLARRWGDDMYVRYLLTTLPAILVSVFCIVAAEDAQGPLALNVVFGASIGITVFAILVFLDERGRRLEIGATAVRLDRGFPLPRTRQIAWEKIETVKADVRTLPYARLHPVPALASTIRSLFEGRGFMTDEELVDFDIRGDGQRLPFSNRSYRLLPEMGTVILERAREAAVRWSLRQFRDHGTAALGPVLVTRQGLVLSRSHALKSRAAKGLFLLNAILGLITYGMWWIFLGIRALIRKSRGGLHVEFENLREIALDGEFVRLETSTGTLWLEHRRIPNGTYLVQIVREAMDLAPVASAS